MQDADPNIDRHITNGTVIITTATRVNAQGIIYKNAVVKCDRYSFEADIDRHTDARLKLNGFVSGKCVFSGYVVVPSKPMAMELAQACRKVMSAPVATIDSPLLDDETPIPHGC